MHGLPDGYSDTPTPLPAVPRRVARARGAGGLWAVRLFILPHTFAGILVLVVFVGRVALLVAGNGGVGQITRIEMQESRKSGRSYTVHFRYDEHGRVESGTDSLKSGEYAKLQSAAAAEGGGADLVGMRVAIRHLALGSWRQARLADYSGESAPLGFMLLWLAFWWSVLSVFLWQAWGAPLRTRRLVKWGVAVAGVVTGMDVHEGKGKTYCVEYEYDGPMGGERFNRKMRTDAHGFEQVSIGDAVTVLYHPARPKRSTVYEACAYRTVDAADDKCLPERDV